MKGREGNGEGVRTWVFNCEASRSPGGLLPAQVLTGALWWLMRGGQTVGAKAALGTRAGPGRPC